MVSWPPAVTLDMFSQYHPILDVIILLYTTDPAAALTEIIATFISRDFSNNIVHHKQARLLVLCEQAHMEVQHEFVLNLCCYSKNISLYTGLKTMKRFSENGSRFYSTSISTKAYFRLAFTPNLTSRIQHKIS